MGVTSIFSNNKYFDILRELLTVACPLSLYALAVTKEFSINCELLMNPKFLLKILMIIVCEYSEVQANTMIAAV